MNFLFFASQIYQKNEFQKETHQKKTEFDCNFFFSIAVTFLHDRLCHPEMQRFLPKQ